MGCVGACIGLPTPDRLRPNYPGNTRIAESSHNELQLKQMLLYGLGSKTIGMNVTIMVISAFGWGEG